VSSKPIGLICDQIHHFKSIVSESDHGPHARTTWSNDLGQMAFSRSGRWKGLKVSQ